ncbi:hypothetical protein TPA0910_66770 [Streptomyces hygroscopicus subsp. sporocinereus]|uniref:Uncharacterized protein n=1 Tax=Streptomyces hygroscopicus TaxID=1912 RepID=A0ABQ3U9G2_STRHY|nr:hypothetical protein TPA0910_66770 [Streptomyces hygroscopicus]
MTAPPRPRGAVDGRGTYTGVPHVSGGVSVPARVGGTGVATSGRAAQAVPPLDGNAGGGYPQTGDTPTRRHEQGHTTWAKPAHTEA